MEEADLQSWSIFSIKIMLLFNVHLFFCLKVFHFLVFEAKCKRRKVIIKISPQGPMGRLRNLTNSLEEMSSCYNKGTTKILSKYHHYTDLVVPWLPLEPRMLLYVQRGIHTVIIFPE